MRQAGLFEKAAECERQMETETDPIKRTVLRLMRDMWIALANESPNMTPEELAKHVTEIEAIERNGKPH